MLPHIYMYLNNTNYQLLTILFLPITADTPGGPRRQQQREPPVDRYRTIAVGRIIGLGEGVD